MDSAGSPYSISFVATGIFSSINIALAFAITYAPFCSREARSSLAIDGGILDDGCDTEWISSLGIVWSTVTFEPNFFARRTASSSAWRDGWLPSIGIKMFWKVILFFSRIYLPSIVILYLESVLIQKGVFLMFKPDLNNFKIPWQNLN